MDNKQYIYAAMRMHAKLQGMAWFILYEYSKDNPGNFDENEKEFIKTMTQQAEFAYANIDEITADYLNDHAGQALMQSAIAPHIEKFSDLKR